jgi:large subunit ribosomal protein L19
MSNAVLDKINHENLKKADVPQFGIGDSVRVHVKIKEGDKERIQVFAGTVIARAGRGATETFTVRRVSFGEGVERVFPVHSPHVASVETETKGRTRRAKLYYLRRRVGRSARVKQAAES